MAIWLPTSSTSDGKNWGKSKKETKKLSKMEIKTLKSYFGSEWHDQG